MSLFREIFSYGLIGLLASGTDTLIFAVLTEAVLIPHLVANLIGVCVGIIISFTLNRRYTFKKEDHTARRFGTFFAVGLCGLLLSEAMLYTGIEVLGFSAMLVKVVSVCVVAAFQFVLNKLVSFRDMA